MNTMTGSGSFVADSNLTGFALHALTALAYCSSRFCIEKIYKTGPKARYASPYQNGQTYQRRPNKPVLPIRAFDYK